MVLADSETSWNYYATTKLLLYHLTRRNNPSTVTWTGQMSHVHEIARQFMEPRKDSTLSPPNNLSRRRPVAFKNRSI